MKARCMKVMPVTSPAVLKEKKENTMTYAELREIVKGYEQELAYGSETVLWGEFYRSENYRGEDEDDEEEDGFIADIGSIP
mgnify:CR=1 FL=1